MFNKFLVTALSVVTLTLSPYGFAKDDSCEVQVAVSTPLFNLIKVWRLT